MWLGVVSWQCLGHDTSVTHHYILVTKRNAAIGFFTLMLHLLKNETELGNLKQNLQQMLLLLFSNILLIIYGVNKRPVSKSIFANLTTLLYSMCFHYRCAASLILTSTVQESPELRLSSDKKQERPLNLVLLVFEQPLVTGGPCTWLFRSRPSLA